MTTSRALNLDYSSALLSHSLQLAQQDRLQVLTDFLHHYNIDSTTFK
jgi:hypothetical protein